MSFGVSRKVLLATGVLAVLAAAFVARAVASTHSVTVQATSDQWVDTGYTVPQGGITVHVTGDATCHAGGASDCPVGQNGQYTCEKRPGGPLSPGPAGPNVDQGALAARLGAKGTPFQVADGQHIPAGPDLQFVYNDCDGNVGYTDNAGSFTITWQDPATATVSVANASPAFGGRVPSGDSATISFPVTVSGTFDSPVTVSYATADGTGRNAALAAHGDYTPTSGTVTFTPAGAVSHKVVVTVHASKSLPKGTIKEFKLNLSNPSSNASIGRGTAIGSFEISTRHVADAVEVGGRCYIRRVGEASWTELHTGDEVDIGDQVNCSGNGFVVLRFLLGAQVEVGANTTVEVVNPHGVKEIFISSQDDRLGSRTPAARIIAETNHLVPLMEHHEQQQLQIQTTGGVLGIKG